MGTGRNVSLQLQRISGYLRRRKFKTNSDLSDPTKFLIEICPHLGTFECGDRPSAIRAVGAKPVNSRSEITGEDGGELKYVASRN